MQIGLGTVQFGLNYGISNVKGAVPLSEVKNILQLCQGQNIRLFDTAAAYGNSEEVLGKALPTNDVDIVTKIPATPDLNREFITSTVKDSLTKLHTTSLYGLLLHDADALLSNNGDDIFQSLTDLKSAGITKKIGVSVYSPEQLRKIISRYNIDLVQLPLNLFDQRFYQSGLLEQLKANNVEIHSRSTFLQGLLLMDLDKLPDYFKPYLAHISQYFKLRGDNPLVAPIHFIKNLNLIDYLIVGCTSATELAQILDAYHQNINLDYSQFASNDDGLILPTNWN